MSNSDNRIVEALDRQDISDPPPADTYEISERQARLLAEVIEPIIKEREAEAFERGCDVTYAQAADEIADLRARLAAAYAEDKPTHSPTWSETYAETLRHGEDEAVS